MLLATVTDMAGRSMVDFEADDFVVSEGGRDREILDVHIADYPVALLLDDTAPAAIWPALRAAAIRFITRIGERPVIIGTLAGDGRIVAPIELDRLEMFARLDTLAPIDGGMTVALPAIAAASQSLAATESPFSAIVVVASGPVGPDMVPGHLLPQIVESGATVHAIVSNVGGAAAADVLKGVAEQTHGSYTPIFASASYGIALDRLADRLAAEMMVQYLVPPGDRTADVKVGVRRPGARVLGLGVSK